jgi:hypothetical protein
MSRSQLGNKEEEKKEQENGKHIQTCSASRPNLPHSCCLPRAVVYEHGSSADEFWHQKIAFLTASHATRMHMARSRCCVSTRHGYPCSSKHPRGDGGGGGGGEFEFSQSRPNLYERRKNRWKFSNVSLLFKFERAMCIVNTCNTNDFRECLSPFADPRPSLCLHSLACAQ